MLKYWKTREEKQQRGMVSAPPGSEASPGAAQTPISARNGWGWVVAGAGHAVTESVPS